MMVQTTKGKRQNKDIKLSVVLATFNEEKNLPDCLESVKDIAGEIIIVDGTSTDKTREIAKEYGARVIVTTNPSVFHINKQKALDAVRGEWILQLDADEKVTEQLSNEIKKVIKMDQKDLANYQENLPNRKLFLRHQKLLESRDGKVGMDGEYVAFFISRMNYFLGKYLKYGGVYPDGVIRLVKNGFARFPAKDVHEQIEITGRVGWLQNPLLHKDSPTFRRYWEKNNRYVNLISDDLKRKKVGKNPIQVVNYIIYKPLAWFFITQFRHKGVMDGIPGIVFSFFSALRFPRAYWRYLND